jgi:molybdopterin molybdotransferase
MLSVAEATARVLSGVTARESETVSIGEAEGRVLADDVAARWPSPQRDLSAMDGYAVRVADLSSLPARLRIVERLPAGAIPQRLLHPGEAARIFTGGALPEGADGIVIQENADEDGDCAVVREGAPAGKHIRRAGLDFALGKTVLAAPRILTPEDIALAASAGASMLRVRRKPVVAILATGDELVPPGTEPGPGQIVASSGLGLAAMIRAAGGEARDLGIAGDDAGAIRTKLRDARGADVLVTLGGASVGAPDLTKDALAAEGVTLDFWKIAMRPGKPLIHARWGAMPVLGLPGNPVSALVCARLFLVPLIEAMLGFVSGPPARLAAVLATAMDANDGREDYVRASVSLERGRFMARPWPVQDSSMLSALSACHALIVRAPAAPAAKAGDPVDLVALPGLARVARGG